MYTGAVDAKIALDSLRNSFENILKAVVVCAALSRNSKQPAAVMTLLTTDTDQASAKVRGV